MIFLRTNPIVEIRFAFFKIPLAELEGLRFNLPQWTHRPNISLFPDRSVRKAGVGRWRIF
jgi:hypothetical protein